MSKGGPHPRYHPWVIRLGRDLLAGRPEPREYDEGDVRIGDEVAGTGDPDRPLGTVTDIHGQTFGDGPGDTITVIPAAVTLSTGDRYPVADLVLLRRGES